MFFLYLCSFHTHKIVRMGLWRFRLTLCERTTKFFVVSIRARLKLFSGFDKIAYLIESFSTKILKTFYAVHTPRCVLCCTHLSMIEYWIRRLYDCRLIQLYAPTDFALSLTPTTWPALTRSSIHTHTRTQSLSIYPVNLSRTLYTSVRAVPKKTIHIENAHEHSSCQQRERETEHTACGRKTNGKAMWWWWSIVIVVCVYQVNVFLSRGQRLSNQMTRFQIST